MPALNILVILPMSSHSTYYRVSASDRVRYLGFYRDHKLQWHHHVTTMTNRAKSALKSLPLLGNSVWGLDFMRWRLAYNAICLPILSYGIQLWYQGQVGLVMQLQGAQNDAVRIISGAFKTAPRDPLHQLLAILPFGLRIQMLMKYSALRLYRLPRESQLLKRLGDPWSSPREGDLPSPAPPPTTDASTQGSLPSRSSSHMMAPVFTRTLFRPGADGTGGPASLRTPASAGVRNSQHGSTKSRQTSH
jgi:hypothetical protein